LGWPTPQSPGLALGRPFTAIVRPRTDPASTAIRQVEALGFSATDVQHIITTHLDVDHAGGLPDFPDATVHVHAIEKDAALTRGSFEEKNRYRPGHFAHGPKWAKYEAIAGEPWFGFPAVRSLPWPTGGDPGSSPPRPHARACRHRGSDGVDVVAARW